jgi:transcriptional regulator with XRE-family HTH domain
MTVLNQRINKAPWNIKLAVLRIMNGWSMKETAERLCVHSRIYQNWESGRFKPHPSNQVRLAKLYAVPQQEIFGPPKLIKMRAKKCLEYAYVESLNNKAKNRFAGLSAAAPNKSVGC